MASAVVRGSPTDKVIQNISKLEKAEFLATSFLAAYSCLDFEQDILSFYLGCNEAGRIYRKGYVNNNCHYVCLPMGSTRTSP